MPSISTVFRPAARKPQEPIRPFPYIEQEVAFVNAVDGTLLHGTLTLPDQQADHPAVILVTGSGAQNRDEQIGSHRPFLVIADHLTRAGVAVLRYDDRHLGMSVKQGWKYTTMDLAGDAQAALDFLHTRPHINSQFIGIAGHSEGGVIAPIVASIDPRVAFIISLAGPGVSGREIALRQAELLAEDHRARRFRMETIEILMEEPDIARRKQRIIRLHHAIYGRFNLIARLKLGLYLDMIASAWNKFFIEYNPMDAWERVTCPTLALIGEYDIQVNAQENLAAIDAALRRAGSADHTGLMIPQANHLMQIVGDGGAKGYQAMLREYLETEQTFSPDVLKIMSEWILRQLHQAHRA